jgi:c-di-AMP phosphodiesterase-like protein
MKIQLKILIVTSVLFFLSIFSFNWKVLGIFTLIWVATVFWNLVLMFRIRNLTANDFVRHIDNKIDKAKAGKKHFRKAIYCMVIPMIVIGLLVVGLDIIGMIILF